MSRFTAPIGIHDFAKLRRSGAAYVDKTAFIAEWLRSPHEVTLIPRPRRFGKTLNLSTVAYFLRLDGDDRRGLFEDLAIWKEEAARAHFGRYPVIAMTFKDAKATTWPQTEARLKLLLAELCDRHAEVLTSDRVSPLSKDVIGKVLRREADSTDCGGLLRHLSAALADHHRAPVAILIDEYDAPIHSAYAGGFVDEALSFFRELLGSGLKDNPHLFKGLLTGILRIAKESIFSDLNHLAVHTVLDPRYATAFGFTEDEVVELATQAGVADRIDAMRDWYNGYRFSGHVIYNPWSVLNFLSEPDRPPRAHWRLTGSDEIIRSLLRHRSLRSDDWARLLAGEAVDKPVMEALALRDVARHPSAVWSFLLFSGYLTATEIRYGESEVYAAVRIPNREVRGVFESVFRRWLDDALDSDAEVDDLLRALVEADADAASHYLTRVLTEQASYYDFPRGTGEVVYHAFVLGLLVRLGGAYRVRSNPESGYGRADVLIIPKSPGEPGVVIELKTLGERDTPEQSLDAAMAQIETRAYATELRAAGATPIHAMAVVFDGKRAHVRTERGGPASSPNQDNRRRP